MIAYDGMQKFMRINKACTTYSDFHMQKVSAINLNEHDAAVAISYSGETQQVIDCVKIAQSKGAKVIAITKYADSRLSDIADAVYLWPHKKMNSEVPPCHHELHH